MSTGFGEVPCTGHARLLERQGRPYDAEFGIRYVFANRLELFQTVFASIFSKSLTPSRYRGVN